MMVNITDAKGDNMDVENMTDDTSVINSAYKYQNSENKLEITTAETAIELQDKYRKWINKL